MKTIVLPTDFSENAWKAMCYSASLFGSEPCTYIILHTYSVPMANAVTDVEGFYASLKREADNELKEIEADFQDLDIHDDSVVEVRCELGYLVPELIRLEEKHPLDFIVMGTKGISGPGEYFLGSTTSAAIGKCSSPVICVPNNAELNLAKEILFAIDGDGIKYISAISPIVDFCHKFDSKIHFAYVSPELTEKNKEVQELDKFVIDNFYKDVNYEFEHIKGEMVEDEIINYAHKNKVDLIVMIKHDRGFWKNLFHKSTTKTLSFHTDVPLCILKDK